MDLFSFGILLVLSLFLVIGPATSITPALILTPYVKENNTDVARHLSVVKGSLFLNRTSHAGFLTIDPRLNSNTFFWYFPVEGKPVDKTPWIIWLQGGPGASSLVGLFSEIGPFEFSDGELKHRKFAWSNNYSMLFIDNPVGVGFSFTDSEEGFAQNMSSYSNHLYSALQQFLTIFPELRKAPLFLAGESYAGRYIPALASRIVEAGVLPEDWEINLEGLIMGNPVLNREDVVNITDAFYQWGLIDSQGVLAVKPLQDLYNQAIRIGNNAMGYQLRSKLLDKLQDITMQQQTYNLLADNYKLTDFTSFLEKEEVREALHVGLIKYSYRNDTVQAKLIPDFLSQVQPELEKLLERFKILIYCGQLDLTVPCVPNAEARRRKWHWSKRDEFLNASRVPWWYEESVAGYVKSGGGFTEVLVRGAGHLVPVDKPAQILQLVSTFIQDIEVELPPNYEPSKEDTPELPYHPDHKHVVTTQSSVITTQKIPDKEKISNSSEVSTIKPYPNNSSAHSTETNTAKSYIYNNISAGTIVSVIFNVILVLIVAIGGVLYYRLKRRSEDFFYNNVETNSDDIFLT